MNKLIKDCCELFGITEEDFQSKRRIEAFVYARHIFSYIAWYNQQMTLKEIGKLMGNRNHSTVIYGIRTVEQRLRADHSYRHDVDDILKRYDSL